MALSSEQTEYYQTVLKTTRQEIDKQSARMEEELSKVKERLAELQNATNALKQIYDGTCRILGVENDLDKDDDASAD